MLLGGGWVRGDRSGWDVGLALFPARVVDFVRAAQPDLWEQTAAYAGDDMAARMVERLGRELDTKGTLKVLRRGFRFHGKTFRVASFRPAHDLNREMVELFERNELSVTRQVRCHPGRRETVDMVFALNGIPVATCELKNPMTGTTWRDAVGQYKRDRIPDAPLFRFSKRALVHFAADPDEIHMTTRLAGEKTGFLPFNRGSHPGAVRCGAGNPQHESGYRTAYFWQDVLERGRFLDILGSYMFVEKRERKVYGAGGARIERDEKVIFPRYHQLDAVDTLVEATRRQGTGHNYLIQHSAGSGKTNSIRWLAHRLSTLTNGTGEKVYDSVIVISDRKIVDNQLRDAVDHDETVGGVVAGIDIDTKQLAEALRDGRMIVVTTAHKFSFVTRSLLSIEGAASPDTPTEEELALIAPLRRQIAGRRYALIVDEAHSGQSGERARAIKATVGSRATPADDGADDWEDRLNAVVEARGPQPNISFYAFTATPKAKTIELFGQPGPDGTPRPFHVYSMRQAIEERFILDVLSNYTDYDTYYRLVKQAEDDEEFPRRRTAVALGRFMSLHPHNIAQKTEVIIEHFRNHVRFRLGGRAKAMVVTSSRLHAVRYMQAFERYIREQDYTDVHPLAAFSGTVHDPDTGAEYTEPRMNIARVTHKPIPETALPARFDSPDYQILLVANKYQTGFNQPLLQAMYVDKRLDGVQAVQTLSRLNRLIPGKSAPFVLDFVNDPEDIRQAFAPYFDATQLRQPTDPYQLDRLKHELDETYVYRPQEVDAFARAFYTPAANNQMGSHARLQAHLQPARDRFGRLSDDQQAEFTDRVGAFVNLYAFLSQIIPYADSELEQLSAFGRALLPYLRADRQRETVRLGDAVELEYYRLQQVSSGTIQLGDDDAQVVGPSAVGTGTSEEPTAPLSEIIQQLNDRFGTSFTEADRLFFEQIERAAVEVDYVRRIALANNFERFDLGTRDQIRNVIIDRMAENDAIAARCLNDPDFEEVVFSRLLRSIYDTIRTQEPTLGLD